MKKKQGNKKISNEIDNLFDLCEESEKASEQRQNYKEFFELLMTDNIKLVIGEEVENECELTEEYDSPRP